MPAPRNPRYERTVRDSFGAQRFMRTIGARLERVAPGEIEIRVPFRSALTPQHGFLHAATMLATIMTIRDRPDVVG